MKNILCFLGLVFMAIGWSGESFAKACTQNFTGLPNGQTMTVLGNGFLLVNNPNCSIASYQYTCNESTGKWKFVSTESTSIDKRNHFLVMTENPYFEDGVPVCECGTIGFIEVNAAPLETYNAKDINGNTLNVCCSYNEIGFRNTDSNGNSAITCKRTGYEYSNIPLYHNGNLVYCPDAGSYPLSVDENKTNCPVCPKGYYCDGSKRTLCEPGKYNEEEGQTSCSVCPEGYFCPGDIVFPYPREDTAIYNSKGENIYYDDVPDSDYNKRGGRIACPGGYYTNKTGQSVCLKCTEGTTNTGSGKTSCDVYTYTNLDFGYNGAQDTSWKWPEKVVTPHNSIYKSVSRTR